jgi:hypothetical protein
MQYSLIHLCTTTATHGLKMNHTHHALTIDHINSFLGEVAPRSSTPSAWIVVIRAQLLLDLWSQSQYLLHSHKIIMAELGNFVFRLRYLCGWVAAIIDFAVLWRVWLVKQNSPIRLAPTQSPIQNGTSTSFYQRDRCVSSVWILKKATDTTSYFTITPSG